MIFISPQPQVAHVLHGAKQVGSTVILGVDNANRKLLPTLNMRNYTELSHTMIGRKRLDNLQYCVETVLEDGVAGDLIETGIWRGGATIFYAGYSRRLRSDGQDGLGCGLIPGRAGTKPFLKMRILILVPGSCLSWPSIVSRYVTFLRATACLMSR